MVIYTWRLWPYYTMGGQPMQGPLGPLVALGPLGHGHHNVKMLFSKNEIHKKGPH